MKTSTKNTLLTGLMAFASVAFSGSMGTSDIIKEDSSRFRFSSYFGSNWAQISPSNIYLTDENDSLNSPTHPTDFTWGLGAAYRWFVPNTSVLNLHDISVGLDITYFKTQQEGQSWQHNDPNFFNYTYQLPVTSLRFMVNSEWTFQRIPVEVQLFNQPIAVYPLINAGIGLARNTMRYYDNPLPEYGGSGLVIAGDNHFQLAWGLGAGFKVPFLFNHHLLETSLRYLYTDLGQSTTQSAANAILIAPLTAHLSSQALLFGLSVLI